MPSTNPKRPSSRTLSDGAARDFRLQQEDEKRRTQVEQIIELENTLQLIYNHQDSDLDRILSAFNIRNTIYATHRTLALPKIMVYKDSLQRNTLKQDAFNNPSKPIAMTKNTPKNILILLTDIIIRTIQKADPQTPPKDDTWTVLAIHDAFVEMLAEHAKKWGLVPDDQYLNTTFFEWQDRENVHELPQFTAADEANKENPIYNASLQKGGGINNFWTTNIDKAKRKIDAYASLIHATSAYNHTSWQKYRDKLLKYNESNNRKQAMDQQAYMNTASLIIYIQSNVLKRQTPENANPYSLPDMHKVVSKCIKALAPIINDTNPIPRLSDPITDVEWHRVVKGTTAESTTPIDKPKEPEPTRKDKKTTKKKKTDSHTAPFKRRDSSSSDSSSSSASSPESVLGSTDDDDDEDDDAKAKSTTPSSRRKTTTKTTTTTPNPRQRPAPAQLRANRQAYRDAMRAREARELRRRKQYAQSSQFR